MKKVNYSTGASHASISLPADGSPNHEIASSTDCGGPILRWAFLVYSIQVSGYEDQREFNLCFEMSKILMDWPAIVAKE